MKHPTIILTVEGGVIQGILTDNPVDVFVIDYDRDGIPESELCPIPQDGGGTSLANAHMWSAGIEHNPKRVKELADVIEKFEEEQDQQLPESICDDGSIAKG